jgi:hypothetical protein
MKVGFLFESGMNQSISEVVKIAKQIRRISQIIRIHLLAPHPASSPAILWITTRAISPWTDQEASPMERHHETDEPKTKAS